MADLLEELEKVALGELHLTIQQFGEMTVGQINAMVEGYMRRRDALEDLFIAYSALPTYQTQLGRKAPSYKKLTAHRQNRRKVGVLDNETKDFWRKIIEEGGSDAKISRNQKEPD